MSFEEDIAAAVEAFGVNDVGLVWGLGMVPWGSSEERDDFIRAVQNKMQG